MNLELRLEITVLKIALQHAAYYSILCVDRAIEHLPCGDGQAKVWTVGEIEENV